MLVDRLPLIVVFRMCEHIGSHKSLRGFIGFEGKGTLIISPVAHRPSLERVGVETRSLVNVGGFTEGQRSSLDFHRNSVLLRAVR